MNPRLISDDKSSDASIVIISFNTRDLLRECIQTVDRNSGDVAYETIVVDNASLDGSADMVMEEFPAVRLVRSPVNLGFGAANNRGFALARGRYVVLLNSDAFLHPHSLERAVQHMDANPQVGLSGGRLVEPDGSWQPSVRMFPSPLNEILTLTGFAAKYGNSRFFGRMDRTWADPLEPGPADWVPGAFTVVRREVLEQLEYFDERFFFYFEEIDLCRRVKAAGFSIWYWPDVVVTHLGGKSAQAAKGLANLTISSSGGQLNLWRMRSQLLYYRKHHGAVGAWTTMMIETWWNRLRSLRNSASDVLARRNKARESQMTIATMKLAWHDTRGGRISPPRPWGGANFRQAGLQNE
jgi:GT2 family glycosyltransferase